MHKITPQQRHQAPSCEAVDAHPTLRRASASAQYRLGIRSAFGTPHSRAIWHEQQAYRQQQQDGHNFPPRCSVICPVAVGMNGWGDPPIFVLQRECFDCSSSDPGTGRFYLQSAPSIHHHNIDCASHHSLSKTGSHHRLKLATGVVDTQVTAAAEAMDMRLATHGPWQPDTL